LCILGETAYIVTSHKSSFGTCHCHVHRSIHRQCEFVERYIGTFIMALHIKLLYENAVLYGSVFH